MTAHCCGACGLDHNEEHACPSSMARNSALYAKLLREAAAERAAARTAEARAWHERLAPTQSRA